MEKTLHEISAVLTGAAALAATGLLGSFVFAEVTLGALFAMIFAAACWGRVQMGAYQRDRDLLERR